LRAFRYPQSPSKEYVDTIQAGVRQTGTTSNRTQRDRIHY